jgi:hypothetical protein
MAARASTSSRAAVVALVVLLVTACAKDPPSTDTSKTTPSVSAAPSPSTPAPIEPVASGSAVTDATAPKLACRAIAVASGDAGGGGAMMMKIGDLLAEDAFVDLPAGARITAKHPRTTREATVLGPAHARFCVGYEDETWLASGTFKSAPGSGEAPGTESWIVTPYGVARYSAGSVAAKVEPGRLDVTVTSGAAYVWSGEPTGGADAGGDTWQKVTTGTASTAGLAAPEPLDARSAKHAVTRCKAAADGARSIAISMTPDGGPPKDLGRLAGAHVVARKEGRAACGVARLRVALLPPSDERAALISAVETAAQWAALR